MKRKGAVVIIFAGKKGKEMKNKQKKRKGTVGEEGDIGNARVEDARVEMDRVRWQLVSNPTQCGMFYHICNRRFA